MKTSTSLMFTFFFLINLIMSSNSNKSPSKMIFSMILIIMFSCTYFYKLWKNSWFSISLYMVMIGGLMVMFSLVASISPKMNPHSMKINNITIIMMLPLFMLMTENKSMFSQPPKTINFKMNIIFIIILLLNFMLIFISKLIINPLKPFRSMMN